MDLTQKIGQLLIVGIPSHSINKDVAESLKKWQVGGIILFSRNLQNASQAKKLISELNDLLSTNDAPLWICVDQEGGVVVRMTQDVSVFPGNMALGATQNRDLAYNIGKQTALEWVPLGVNVNFAPVLDLNYAQNPGIGVRSFGQDKDEVAELGAKMICGMQEHALLATAKHFPGKGLAQKDAHLDLPRIEASTNRLFETECPPFEEAFKNKVAFAMSSHCIYKELDPDRPGTLSKAILTTLLRQKMGFQGLVVSDDLEMGAIQKFLPVEEAALQFLKVGGDQILVCHTPEAQGKVLNRILDAVKNNEITEEEIDEKVDRILKAKKNWYHKKQKINFEKRDSSDLSLQVARQSITLLKNEANLVPIQLKKDQKIVAICADYSPLTLVEENSNESLNLEKLLHEVDPHLAFFKISSGMSFEAHKELKHSILGADLLLLFTYNAHMDPVQIKFFQDCLKSGVRSIMCALRNPFDLREFPQVSSFLASYGFRSDSLKALVEVLFGEIPPLGKCPVELNQS